MEWADAVVALGTSVDPCIILILFVQAAREMRACTHVSIICMYAYIDYTQYVQCILHMYGCMYIFICVCTERCRQTWRGADREREREAERESV